jgi:hypothetical protein
MDCIGFRAAGEPILAALGPRVSGQVDGFAAEACEEAVDGLSSGPLCPRRARKGSQNGQEDGSSGGFTLMPP